MFAYQIENCFLYLNESNKINLLQGTLAASLLQYQKLMVDLTPEQIRIVKHINFGDLLKTPSTKLRRLLCQSIAETYDMKQDAFVIGGVPCRITLKEVELITGLPSMGFDFVPSDVTEHIELWKLLKEPGETKITLKGLLMKMSGDESPNFLRPFVMYTIGRYVCPTTQPYVDPKYLGIVKTVDAIRDTNFAKLTLDHLMANVGKFVSGAANLEGNLALLQVNTIMI